MTTSNKSIRDFRAPLCLLAILADPSNALASEPIRASSPRLSQVLDDTDPRHPLSEEVLQALGVYAPFLEVLPLERVIAVRGIDERVEVAFDCGRQRHIDVELPDREEWLLDRKDGDLRRGKPRLEKIEGRKLRIRDEIHLYVRNGEITAIREGDIQVVVGPFTVDLRLSTHSDPGRIARDDRDRIFIARDERGQPANISGEWVPQRFDHWVRVTARKQEFWIGVRTPREEVAFLATPAAL